MEVGVGLLLRTDHVLHRETRVDQIAIRRDVHLLEMVQQRRPVVPGHVLGPGNDVVPQQRRDRNERQVVDVQFDRELSEFFLDLLEPFLRPAHQVHFVHTQHEVGYPQESGQEGVPPRLFEHPFASIHQDQGKVGRRRAGHHVAGVLLVPGSVRDDELPMRGREIPVGHVDRDALFTLGAQSVGQ